MKTMFAKCMSLYGGSKRGSTVMSPNKMMYPWPACPCGWRGLARGRSRQRSGAAASSRWHGTERHCRWTRTAWPGGTSSPQTPSAWWEMQMYAYKYMH